MKGAYYNEVDPHAAQWLRNLIAAGHIAAGDVDERSIVDVRADDLRGYTQCHFFAGIGVWSYALRCAGWPDDRPVWTGSCPCQPFSSAGKGLGHEDERHLWPTWFRLIGESRPRVVFGEQVADGDGYAWLDVVGNDVESIGYALGAVCPAACGVGAPHIRQRLYFVADANSDGCGASTASRLQHEEHHTESCGHSVGVALGDTQHAGLEGHSRDGDHGHESGRDGAQSAGSASEAGFSGVVVDTTGRGFGVSRDASQQAGGGYPDGSDQGICLDHAQRDGRGTGGNYPGRAGKAIIGPVNGFWRGVDWVWCRDPSGPRWRPVEPGTFPLAHGASSRVVKLRAYGNAIVAPVATEFIKAYLDCRGR